MCRRLPGSRFKDVETSEFSCSANVFASKNLRPPAPHLKLREPRALCAVCGGMRPGTFRGMQLPHGDFQVVKIGSNVAARAISVDLELGIDRRPPAEAYRSVDRHVQWSFDAVEPDGVVRYVA